MKTYSITKTVTENDLDDLNHVNNIVYVQWIQEISKEHWNEVTKSLDLDCIWVVRRHDITYYSAAKLLDEIVIKTTVLKARGPITFRQVEMTNNKTGKVLVKSITEWCLLNDKTFRPMRISENLKDLFLDT